MIPMVPKKRICPFPPPRAKIRIKTWQGNAQSYTFFDEMLIIKWVAENVQ
jgi:hypothetical protein